MQAVTKQKARRVRRALLALSDEQLTWIVEDWLKAALRAWPTTEADDQALFALGYQIKVTTTGQVYSSWDDLQEDAEVDTEDITLVPPMETQWRATITRLGLPTFYHAILWAAGEALDNTAFTDNWGPPPGEKRSGYAFLDKLADHLILARRLGENSLERFTYAARRLYLLSHEEEELEYTPDEGSSDLLSPYPDIDTAIEQFVREPELPYWLRMQPREHRRKRK